MSAKDEPTKTNGELKGAGTRKKRDAQVQGKFLRWGANFNLILGRKES